MNGYGMAEEFFVSRLHGCIVLSANGGSLDDGPVDGELFSTDAPEPERSLAQVINASSVEEALRKLLSAPGARKL